MDVTPVETALAVGKVEPNKGGGERGDDALIDDEDMALVAAACRRVSGVNGVNGTIHIDVSVR